MGLIERILAQIGVPLNLILEQLDAFALEHPDLAGTVAQAKALLAERYPLDALLLKAKADAEELVRLIQEGEGPIDPDNITDIQ